MTAVFCNVMSTKMNKPWKSSRVCEICWLQEKYHHGETFFATFPLNEPRCREWVKAVGKEDLAFVPIEKLHTQKFVCGNHFEETDYNPKTHRLKRWAIPRLKLLNPALTEEQLKEFPLHLPTYGNKSDRKTVFKRKGFIHPGPRRRKRARTIDLSHPAPWVKHDHTYSLTMKPTAGSCETDNQSLYDDLDKSTTMDIVSDKMYVALLPELQENHHSEPSEQYAATDDRTSSTSADTDSADSQATQQPTRAVKRSFEERRTVSGKEAVMNAVYRGRIDKLEKRIQTLEELYRKSKLTVMSTAKRNRRLKKNNEEMRKKLNELLEKEKVYEEYIMLMEGD